MVPAGVKHVLESYGEIRDDLFIDALPENQQVCRVVAGSTDKPDLIVGCGIVSVRYGPSLDLFDHLQDVLAVDLSSAPAALTAFRAILTEQSNPIPGTDAMTAALMTVAHPVPWTQVCLTRRA